MLKGIDISGHNGWPFNSVTEAGYQQSDFVIVKATQGTSYVSPSFSDAAKRVISDGKLLGFYHYAGKGDACAEAVHFFSIVSLYSKRGIPVLDFEQYQNESNWDDPEWALRFCNRYHEISGVWPMVYVSAAHRAKVASCADHCALWIAGYPRSNITTWADLDFPYKINPWTSWTVWQFTSAGGLDRNWGNLTRDGWNRIACGDDAILNDGSISETFNPETVADLVEGVLSGTFGVVDERAKALGIAYKPVQQIVNELSSLPSTDLAYRAIAGLYGIGEQRKAILGSKYASVQKAVNDILK